MDLKDYLDLYKTGRKYYIRDYNEKIIASLKMVTKEDIENPVLVQKITDWREKNAECFLSVFKPSFDRTYLWLKDSLLPSRNRVLFSIHTLDDTFVGHIGAILREDYIEYDYFIRGEQVAVKEFSLIVAKRFLKWICEETGIGIIKGNVRSDNDKALDFHARTGFVVNKKIPLQKIEISDTEYSLVPNYFEKNQQLFLVEIMLKESDIKF